MSRIIQIIKSKTPLIPAVTWGFLVLYLTLRPKSAGDVVSLPTWMAGLPVDKLAHFGFWGILYGLFHVFYLNNWRGFQRGPKQGVKSSHNRKHQVYGIITMILIGGLVEIFQYHLQWGREAEWADLAADAAGVLTAALFYKRF
jgi:hypothetical protein